MSLVAHRPVSMSDRARYQRRFDVGEIDDRTDWIVLLLHRRTAVLSLHSHGFSRAIGQMRGILGMVALVTLGGACAKQDSVQCDDGRTCPANTVCDDADKKCLTSAQTTSCMSLADGMVCDAEGIPGI